MSVSRSLAWLALALSVGACGNEFPPTVLTSGVAVATYRSPTTDYGAFSTYAIVDKVTYVDDTTGTPVYSFQAAPEILGAIERNMAERGYVLVARIDPANPPAVPPDADLAMNVSVFTGTDYAYVPCDYWAWWGYPGFGCDVGWEWIPYRVGSLLMELGNLRGIDPGPPPVIPRIWAGMGYSVLTPERATNVQIAVEAVDQAFLQSPYLVTP